MFVDHQRLGYGVHDALQDGQTGTLFAALRQHQDEFVAAQARDRVGFARGR